MNPWIEILPIAAIGVIVFCVGYRADKNNAEIPIREPNSYSKLGCYLIEHTYPGKDFDAYTVYEMHPSLCGTVPSDGFSCATRAEAEEFANRLEK